MYYKYLSLYFVASLVISCDKFVITSEDHQIFLDVATTVESNWNSSVLLREYKVINVDGAGLSNKVVLNIKISKVEKNIPGSSVDNISSIKKEINKLSNPSNPSGKNLELNITIE
jgi:hypothetical protein